MSKDKVRTAAVYIRVSTDMQMELSPESQLIEIRRYAAQHNIIILNQYVFIEPEGRSGRKAKNRLQFQNMIATAKIKPRPFDCILVWKFARFARNQDESAFYKSTLRKKLEIDVISISEPIMEGMYGQLMEKIIEWQDEFYSYNLSMEVRRSMSLKAQKGYYNGKVPMGYTKKPQEMPVIQEAEAHIVRMIFDMFVSGRDKNYITRHLNDKGFRTRTGRLFTVETVSYILENPFYIGKVRWNRRRSSSSNNLNDESDWIISDGHHPAIIDNDTFDAAQQRIKQIKETHAKYAHPVSHGKHWLSGMVKCSICGKSLSFKSGYGSTSACDSFQCLGYRNGLHKESQSISARKLSNAVLDSLKKAQTTDNITFSLIRTKSTDEDTERLIYETELKSLAAKETRLREAYMAGIESLEDYRINKGILDERRAELNSLLDELDTPAANPDTYRSKFLNSVNSVMEILESNADYELKGEALRSIVQKIIFYKESQTLEFHYFLSI